MDLPERQRTLRATVKWSVGLLEDAERSLLEAAAVCVDGWTIQAASQVAGMEEERALELSEALARHSLVYADSTGLCARRATWRRCAAVTGSPQAPGCSWASWLCCGAGPVRAGR